MHTDWLVSSMCMFVVHGVLQCDAMRISKKFTGDTRIGHVRYPKNPARRLSQVIINTVYIIKFILHLYCVKVSCSAVQERQPQSKRATLATLVNYSKQSVVKLVCVQREVFLPQLHCTVLTFEMPCVCCF
jgi:hypothetical protein